MATRTPAAGTFDFGDAPDGDTTGYTGAAIGRFPTSLRSNGARALVGKGLHLGPQVDAEKDAHRRGEDFHNDGVVLAHATSCGQAELAVLVTLDEPAPAGGKTVFFNFWADWNHDGAWAGGDRCAREHAATDVSLTVPAGERLTIFAVKLRFGSYSTPFWTRSILSAAPLQREEPTGEVGPGEVEDLPMPFFLPTGQVECGTGLLDHGETGGAPITIQPALFPLNFTQVNSRRLPRWTARLPAPNGITPGPTLPNLPNIANPRLGLIPLESRKPHVDRPPRFEVIVVHGRVVPRRGFQRLFTCRFLVAHQVPTRPPDANPPPSPRPPAKVEVGVKASYVHTPITDARGAHPSRICSRVTTEPAVPDSEAVVTLADESGRALSEETVRLGAQGTAPKDFGIDSFGTYGLSVRLTGRPGTATTTVVVTEAPGPPCP